MTRRAGLAVVAAAAALQAALFALDLSPGGRRLWGDESMYWQAAGRVLERGDSGLELLWPPGQAWFLAAIRGLGGGLLAVALVQVALVAVAAVALRGALRGAGAERRVADGAAALVVLYPTLGAFAHYLWPEVLHLALFCLALWLLAAHRERTAACAALGGVLGLALLTKSLLSPLVPAILAAAAVGGDRRWRRLAAAAVTLAAVLAPTLWLNHRRHGAAIVASSARFNLWVGLNERERREFKDRSTLEALREWRRGGDTFEERQRILAGRIRAYVADHGAGRILAAQLDRQYYRLFGLPSFLTEQLPGGELHGRRRGYRDPPRPLALALGWSHRLTYSAVLLLVPWGLVAGLRRREPWAVAALALIAYTMAIFLLLHVKSRYRIQLLPALLPAAVLGGYRLLDGLRWMRDRASGPAPLGVGEAVTAACGSALFAVWLFGA
ncbi:MAG: glycosyltransferase family 39 protein [Thermoanaerobaculia bacterium]